MRFDWISIIKIQRYDAGALFKSIKDLDILYIMDLSKDRQQNVVNVLETYFSDASLQWDKVMQSKILADPSGSKPSILVCYCFLTRHFLWI